MPAPATTSMGPWTCSMASRWRSSGANGSGTESTSGRHCCSGYHLRRRGTLCEKSRCRDKNPPKRSLTGLPSGSRRAAGTARRAAPAWLAFYPAFGSTWKIPKVLPSGSTKYPCQQVLGTANFGKATIPPASELFSPSHQNPRLPASRRTRSCLIAAEEFWQDVAADLLLNRRSRWSSREREPMNFRRTFHPKTRE